jgi:hypothetical protein
MPQKSPHEIKVRQSTGPHLQAGARLEQHARQALPKSWTVERQQGTARQHTRIASRSGFAWVALVDQTDVPSLGLQSQCARNAHHACTEHCDLPTGFEEIHGFILLQKFDE